MNTDTHVRLQKPHFEISTDKTTQSVDLGELSLSEYLECIKCLGITFGGYQYHINLLKIV